MECESSSFRKYNQTFDEMTEFENTTLLESDSVLSHTENAGLLSFGARRMFDLVNYVFICSLIGVFGIITNSMNMVVFCRQGFKNTMTISFMALAISDIGCLVTLEWFCICMNPLLSSSSLNFVPLEILSATAGWPHVSFARITGWITTYITAERCLCITAPLAVRRIITPTRTTLLLFCIYFINIIALTPEFATCYIGWKFYPEYNRSLVGLIVTNDNEKAEGAVFFMQAVLVLTAFLCVSVLTSVLVIKLRGASKWRTQATQSKDSTEAMSSKDKKATKMVVIISSLLIVLYTPSVILFLISFCESQFSVHGVYKNVFFVIWSFGFICNSLNSSLNIFMYYNMSTKYRTIFNDVFLPSGNRTKSIGNDLPCSQSKTGDKAQSSNQTTNLLVQANTTGKQTIRVDA